MSSDGPGEESSPGFFDPDDLSWEFSDAETSPSTSEEVDLPDPAELFRQMSTPSAPSAIPNPRELYEQSSEPESFESPLEAALPDPALLYEQMEAEAEDVDDLPDPATLFASLTRGSTPEMDPEVEDLPDPAELYHKMIGQDHFESVSPAFEDDLPDPEELYRKLTSQQPLVEEEDLPDSDALFHELTRAQPINSPEVDLDEEDDLPDPGRLFEEMSQRDEVKDDLHLPLPTESVEVPGLWSRLKSRFSTSKDELEVVDDLRLPLPNTPPVENFDIESEDPLDLDIPLPTSKPTRARVEPKAPTGFWDRIKSKFGVEKSEDLTFESDDSDEQEPQVSGELPSLPDARAMFEQMEREGDDAEDLEPAFPSPAELFRQLEREAREEMAASGAQLPDLPDLDSFRALLEEEEREKLDPDLLGDLSGPERFAETVSDLAFASTTEFEKPLPEPEKTVPEEPLPAMLLPPETKAPKKGPTGTVRVDPGSSAPKPKPVYQPSASSSAVPVVKARKKIQVDGASFRETWSRRRGAAHFSRYTLTIFTRQLSAMLKAGVQLHMALSFCADSAPDMARVLDDIGEKIQRGFTMSAAFGEHPKSFDPVYVGLLRSGELSGRLPEVIDRLANVLEREMELRKRVTAALTYPAVLLMVSLLGTLGFIYFVLPMITPLFEDLGVPLPLPTRILMGVRTVMVPTMLLSALAALAAWIMRDKISAYFDSKPKLQRQITGVLYRLPIFGNVYQKLVASRVLYSLATMLDVGVTMNQALARAESAAGNALMKHRLARAREDLADGNPVTDCFSANQVFSGTALHLIGAGEESAQLTEMFTYVAGYYDEEVQHSMDSAASLLEPIIMVVMGLVVGFITISAALPTITLLQNFT